jgi:ankyrin repeat protein
MSRISLFVFTAALGFSQTKLPPASTAKVDFLKDVQPLLAQKCHSCHGDLVQQSGLRLDRRQLALRGGDYGPVIIPGKSAESKLIRRLVNGDGGLQMPPTGPLSDEEIGLLRAWIDQGADFVLEVEEEAPAKPVDPKLANLISAIRSGDLQRVKKLVADSPELVTARDRAGSTPLHHAAGYGTLATMKLLLEKGADVNAANKRKSTPLYWAIDDEAKLRLLIDRGADVNAKTVEGRTPVYQAALMGDGIRTMQMLLEKGAAADVKTLVGMSPLMAAAGRANLPAMRLLIEKHGDVNARNSAGSTALMDAAQTGNAQAVRMLLEKGADPNVKTKKNETALAFAATAGEEETVKLLLDRGADVNVRDIRGYSPLLYAAGSDAMPAGIVKLLLAKGADLKAEGDGETAPMLAAKRGDSAVARLLPAPEEKRAAAAVLTAKEIHPTERSIADAVRPALALLEGQSRNFIRIGGCNSCHAQDLPSAAAGLARDRGLPSPKLIPQLPQHMHANTTERLIDINAVGLNGIGLSWELFDFGMNHVPRDEYTDAVVRFLTIIQAPEGNWPAFQSRRPPMNTGEYQAAALAIYAIRHYGRTEDEARNTKTIARAAGWLERSSPTNTQDRAFRLLGLAWSDANSKSIASATHDLVASQRTDGGWSQLPAMGSDAYATGEALYALNVGGKVSSNDAVYRKGVAYLLNTQAADGSWHVNTRSIWLQPYFESGFPYGHDQWISASGTAWATMALSVTVKNPQISRNLGTE